MVGNEGGFGKPQTRISQNILALRYTKVGGTSSCPERSIGHGPVPPCKRIGKEEVKITDE